jgi:hypothetical protein
VILKETWCTQFCIEIEALYYIQLPLPLRAPRPAPPSPPPPPRISLEEDRENGEGAMICSVLWRLQKMLKARAAR